jgi:hypothetical protein
LPNGAADVKALHEVAWEGLWAGARGPAAGSAPTWTPSPIRTRSAVTGEAGIRGLIDTTIVIHLAAGFGAGM